MVGLDDSCPLRKKQLKQILGGGNSNIFYFYPYLGRWSILTNIFQMGWNHQLECQGEKAFVLVFQWSIFIHSTKNATLRASFSPKFWRIFHGFLRFNYSLIFFYREHVTEFGWIWLYKPSYWGIFREDTPFNRFSFPVEAAFSSGSVFPGLAPIAAKNTSLGWTSRDATKNTAWFFWSNYSGLTRFPGPPILVVFRKGNGTPYFREIQVAAVQGWWNIIIWPDSWWLIGVNFCKLVLYQLQWIGLLYFNYGGYDGRYM